MHVKAQLSSSLLSRKQEPKKKEAHNAWITILQGQLQENC